MRRELTIRATALIAISLAVGSTCFCWALSQRSRVALEQRERKLAEFEYQLDELRNQLINVGAFLMRDGEQPSRANLLDSPGSPLARSIKPSSSSSVMRTYETVRATEFVAWYRLAMEKYHQLEAKSRSL